MKTIKKLPYIFFAALYLCWLCACSTAPKEDDVQSSYPIPEENTQSVSHTQTPLPGEQPAANIVPPPSLDFYGIDELQDFVSSYELSDDDFDRFIKEHNYYLCGIQSKTDLINMVERFDELPFPMSEEYSFNFMDYYPELGRYTMVYLMGNGHCYFTFFEGVEGDSESLLDSAIESKNVSLMELDQPTSIRRLYVLNDTNDDVTTFYSDINGYFVEIETCYLSPGEAEEAILSFDFGTLSEFLGE